MNQNQQLARQIILWWYTLQEGTPAIPGKSTTKASSIKDSVYDLINAAKAKETIRSMVIQFLHNNHLTLTEDNSLAIEPKIYSPENMKLEEELIKIKKRMKKLTPKFWKGGLNGLNQAGGIAALNRRGILGFASFHLSSKKEYRNLNALAFADAKDFSDEQIESSDKAINEYLSGENPYNEKWAPNPGLVEQLYNTIINTPWSEDNFKVTPLSAYDNDSKISFESSFRPFELLSEHFKAMSPEAFGKIICYLHNRAVGGRPRQIPEKISKINLNSKGKS